MRSIKKLHYPKASIKTPDFYLDLSLKTKEGDDIIKTYKTSEVAKIIGIHPNTVRLYEDLKLIPKPDRLPNGYRVFNKLHIEHFKLARTALQVEVLQNGLRKQAVTIIKIAALKEYSKAIELTEKYIESIKYEKNQAEEAISIVAGILSDNNHEDSPTQLTRKEAAEYLNITMDTLRNWELNGLITIKRKSNSYRLYKNSDIKILKIIRVLRCANYSLNSILRLLKEISQGKKVDIKEVINTPKQEEDIISICDKLLTSLQAAEVNAEVIHRQLKEMQIEYLKNPPL